MADPVSVFGLDLLADHNPLHARRSISAFVCPGQMWLLELGEGAGGGVFEGGGGGGDILKEAFLPSVSSMFPLYDCLFNQRRLAGCELSADVMKIGCTCRAGSVRPVELFLAQFVS